MKKSAVFLSVIFAATILCGLYGYKDLFLKIYDTIVGVNTVELLGSDVETADGGYNNQKFIIDSVVDEFQTVSLLNKISIFQNRMETKLNNMLPVVKEGLININGGFQRLIGRTIFIDADVGNDVILADNGYLARLQSDDIAVSVDRAAEVISLNEHLEQKGIPMLFSVVPYKIEKVDIPVHRNELINRKYLMDTVSEAGVPTLEWMEAMEADGKEFFSMYYKTDHHWKAESGLWAAGVIAEYCADNLGFTYDKSQLDPDNYTYEVLEDWFLGSIGKRVGTWVTDVDDFTIIHPNFDTNIDNATIIADGEWAHRIGTLEEAMYWDEYIEHRDYLNGSPYAMYSHGNQSIQIIHNNNAPNDKKILVVKYSFANVTMPFLALSCQELNVVDLRNHLRPLNLYEYIDEYQPDLVLFMW